MDSLLAVRLRAFLVNVLQNAPLPLPVTVPRNVIYDHPSISSLVDFVLEFTPSCSVGSQRLADKDIQIQVRGCVERFSTDFAVRKPENCDGKTEERHVVVTGTTGSLGSFLLNNLLDQSDIKRIYCLNRQSSSDTYLRQLASFRDRGLGTSKLEEAVGRCIVFLDIDLSERMLGLTETDYDEVIQSVTTVSCLTFICRFGIMLPTSFIALGTLTSTFAWKVSSGSTSLGFVI
jgi:hypothetical protein